MVKQVEKTESSAGVQSMESWTSIERESLRSKYGCEILIENGSWQQVTTKDAPNDARIVTYTVDDEVRYDLTRGPKVSKIFDMYWDKFREGIKKIQFGYGKISPKLWGYQAPQSKKKK